MFSFCREDFNKFYRPSVELSAEYIKSIHLLEGVQKKSDIRISYT
jgi:hypothetical protein